MPRVQYSCPPKGINECRRLDTPKNVGDLDAWIKSIHKVFPEAPRGYTLSHKIVTAQTICLQFVSNKHEKFAFVVDRRAGS